jgi:hypothetical protein
MQDSRSHQAEFAGTINVSLFAAYSTNQVKWSFTDTKNYY